MILRDAIISDQPRRIGRKHQQAAVQVEPGEAAEPRPDISVSAASGISVIEAVLPQAPLARESRLSFEAVAAWLAVQDGETRAACASMLADELTQAHESAKVEGYAAGHAQGHEEAKRRTQELHASLRTIVDSAESALLQEQAKLAEQCVDIVAEAFTKIAGSLLSTREAAVGAVTEVLKRVKEGRELTIRVSPAELILLQQEEARLAAALPGRKFALVADARVDIGGCIVESKLGSLDGRLEVQLRELYETLRSARAAPASLP